MGEYTLKIETDANLNNDDFDLEGIINDIVDGGYKVKSLEIKFADKY